MSKKPPRPRIVFEYRKRFYKFFAFYTGKDRSIYFKVYRRPEEIGERVQMQRVDGGMLFDGTTILKDQFPADTLSRHPTGVIHVKDATGRRERNGIVSWSFDDTAFKIILCAYPQTLDRLVEIPCPDSSRDVVFHLRDDQENEPFSVQVAINKIGRELKAPPELLTNPIFVLMNDVPTHELVVLLIPVTRLDPSHTFPPRSSFILA